jgi:hypothetical protein
MKSMQILVHLLHRKIRNANQVVNPPEPMCFRGKLIPNNCKTIRIQVIREEACMETWESAEELH